MIFVVLPAFNEEAAILPLLEGIHSTLTETGLAHQFLVVDDGSRDNTHALLEGCKRQFPLTVLTHPENLGLGAAIRSGMMKALEIARAEDVVVTMDADGTHPSTLIPAMIQKVDREGFDVVIASRFRPGAMVLGVPWFRLLTSSVASTLLRLCKPIPGVRDYTSGFRAYRLQAIRDAYERFGDSLFAERSFACMADILIKAATKSPRIAEVPLVLRYDRKAGGSKIHLLRTIGRTIGIALSRVR
jgi:dolichol-phosphate mannosyltransferase